METIIEVKGMTCEACVRSVSRKLGKLGSVRVVHVDLASGTVRLESDSAPPRDQIRQALEAIGYELGGAP